MTTRREDFIPRTIVALDTSDRSTAEDLVLRLKGEVSFFKVGPILFTAAGPSFIEWLKARGVRVFLDLKFHDIPHVVERACRNAARLGVDMITVHASGGIEMMKVARQGAEEGASETGNAVPMVVGVTVLTSYAGRLRSRVLPLTRLAKQAGLAGVVSSFGEARAIRRLCGKDFVIVVPGIRPKGASTHDQRIVTTAAKAFKEGAHFIVVGRPILESPDPIAALHRL